MSERIFSVSILLKSYCNLAPGDYQPSVQVRFNSSKVLLQPRLNDARINPPTSFNSSKVLLQLVQNPGLCDEDLLCFNSSKVLLQPEAKANMVKKLKRFQFF